VPRERVAWERLPPKHAASRLGWTLFVTVLVCGPAYVIFADEPRSAADGAVNPLALVVPALAVLFAVLLTPQLLALARRPIVQADHYALTVRPGVGRTLVLPWAQVAELTVVQVDEEPFLLVRCGAARHSSADVPRWWDQGHLRSASRGAPAAAAYDLAVPISDFLGRPGTLLADLARATPDHVTFVNEID
jgi:hypothetical protein